MTVRIFDLDSPCVPFSGYRNAQGYGQVTYHGVSSYAHRVAYIEHYGITMGSIMGSVVRHKCDNPCCINPDHLELGTRADNNRDRKIRGRNANTSGENHPSNKLTAQEVREIRELYTGKHGQQTRLARKYGVAPSTIHVIVHNKRWEDSE